MSTVRLLIIEDDPPTALDMRRKLANCGWHIPDIVNDASDALTFLSIYKPHLVLMGINSSRREEKITIAKHINKAHNTPVIFFSSYADQDTIDSAKEANPAAFMVEPYSEAQIRVAVEMALYNFTHSMTSSSTYSKTMLGGITGHYLLDDRMFIKKNNRFERVNFLEIQWMQAESNYTKIVTDKTSYTLTLTLRHLFEKIYHPSFIRVHRSYVINMEHIEAFEGNMLLIKGQKIPISKSYREEALKLFLAV